MRQYFDHDYKTICEWMNRRSMLAPARDFLPKIGLIEEDIAAGFLINTDCNIGILDYFCSNPKADRQRRIEALSEIGHALIVTAKRMGMKAMICNTKFENIKGMARNQGFDYTGEYSSFFRGL